MLSRSRIAVSLGMLALLAAYAILLPPQKVGATYLELCPWQINGLVGTDLDLDQTVLDDLDPDAVLSRRYLRQDGLPLWLVIVYFENARLGAHDPHLCYRSQGFDVEVLAQDQVGTALGKVPLESFRAVRGERAEQVYYFWYTAGRKAMADVGAFRDEMFLQGLKSNRSFGAFVRVSTLEDANREASLELLKEFVRGLTPFLPRFFPESAS